MVSPESQGCGQAVDRFSLGAVGDDHTAEVLRERLFERLYAFWPRSQGKIDPLG
jgi:hypothetical protein